MMTCWACDGDGTPVTLVKVVNGRRCAYKDLPLCAGHLTDATVNLGWERTDR